MLAKRLFAGLLVVGLALIGAVPAVAGGPDHFKAEVVGNDIYYCDTDGVYELGPDADGNGFPDWATGAEHEVTGAYTVHFRAHFFYDKEGHLARSWYHGVLEWTITNPDTGEFITEKQTFVDQEEAGQYITNHSWHVKLPGEAPAFQDVGRVIFNAETWEVEFIAGHHPSLEMGGPDYCALLGAGTWIAYSYTEYIES